MQPTRPPRPHLHAAEVEVRDHQVRHELAAGLREAIDAAEARALVGRCSAETSPLVPAGNEGKMPYSSITQELVRCMWVTTHGLSGGGKIQQQQKKKRQPLPAAAAAAATAAAAAATTP